MTHYVSVSGNSECRLCGGATTPVFKKALLHLYDVSFLKCGHCLSLQTETPYWLEDAYKDDRPLTDCGMVARTIDLCAKTDVILSILGVDNEAPCVDFGGSLGLYSRMMRDRGYNFYRSDKYSRNFYVPFHDIEDNDIGQPCVVTAFEVMEHLSNPRQELHGMFASSPDVFLATTAVYMDQASDWWYYAPDIGQHLFFYSVKALHAIAGCYQMHLISDGSLHLFCRKNPKQLHYNVDQLQQISALLNNGPAFHSESTKLLTSRLAEPYKYASRDYVNILNKIESKRKSELAL